MFFFVHARGGDDRIADFTAGADRIAVGGFTDQTPGLTADQWLATLTAQDTDTGLRLTDSDSLGLTLAGLTTASLSADYFLILWERRRASFNRRGQNGDRSRQQAS